MIAEPVVLLSALVTALAAGLVARAIVPPPRRLRDRLMPYVAPVSFSRPTGSGVSAAVFGPIVRDMADWVGRMADRTGGEVTTLKLRQAGWFKGADGHALVSAYRMVLLRNMALAAAAALVVGYALNASVMLRLALVALAFIFGATRVRGKLEKAIDTRRELMRIEIYTVNQLLAMRVRAGGGVIQAVKSVTRRGSGEVVGELEEALRLHRAGWSGPDAFRRIAELTPEPFCGRTYRLLAAAEERGADLAGALLALSDDVRETRRESIKRTATKRRAAMLIPTIAILAPVLILFVAAPLPYLITGWQ
jgi:tight adherence protein C